MSLYSAKNLQNNKGFELHMQPNYFRLNYNFNAMNFYSLINSQKQNKKQALKQQLFQIGRHYRPSWQSSQGQFKLDIKTEDDKISQNQQNQNQSQQDIKGVKKYSYQANQTNQDKVTFSRVKNIQAVIISVFDGHGGVHVSQYCQKNINQLFNNCISQNLSKLQTEPIQVISKALQSVYEQLQNNFFQIYKVQMKKGNRKLRGVGTCAITAVFYKGHIIVASAGDSQAIIISQKQNSHSYKKLSQRFSVNNASQRLRLTKQFGKTDPNIYSQQRKNVFYLKGVLQPTKSIGDYYLKKQQYYSLQDEFKGPYLSCKPAITIHKIQPQDKAFIIASDGLWDYMTKWQILKTVVQCKKLKLKSNNSQLETDQDIDYNCNENENDIQKDPVQKLVNNILQKTAEDFDISVQFLKKISCGERRNYHDDITISFVDLQQFFQQ